MAEPIKLCFAVCSDYEGSTLQQFLRSCGVSATLMKAVKKQTGGFHTEESSIRTCDRVHAGQIIHFFLPPEPETSVEPEAKPLSIAYESEHVIVLDKPAGMAVHPTLNYKNGTLANAYMGLLQRRGQEGVFRPVNRIDKDTSGLVLCAKNMWSACQLSASVKKEYLAVTQGKTPEQGIIDAPIGRAPGSIILRQVDPGGKPSCTEYKTEKTNGRYSLVRAVPVTGRTHQIRVHFAWIGHPLAGDDLYGGSRDEIDRHALHCAVISFEEPALRKRFKVESKVPKDMQALLSRM